MAGLLGTKSVTQIGFIVKDIEASKKTFGTFLGMEPPDTMDTEDYSVTQTTVEGKPAPGAACKLVFFDVTDHLQIELIQPNGVKSTWQDFLDEHGEGIHHIAFQIKNTEEKIAACEDFGMTCLQRGKYDGGNSEYTYLDASGPLKCIVELLENH
ncbi:VOC family protein [Vallitalea pronyensis]|uniref:VOC family protein n=1 Tax=Vallitalea pronyensis TaxID=1348613 RepID=A0A8J8SIV4_9FIRM|nr:VOC family protein [Vallitalea pronyensis]QUI24837.1 VOC family protein [Vallitalea pronyensis]